MTNTQESPVDLSEFQAIDTGEYQVEMSVRGRVTRYVKAASEEEALALVDEKIDAEYDYCIDLDDFDDVSIDYVRKVPVSYLVLRDGKELRTSHVRPGDKPREPNANGF